ncbi:MAG TPA: hypothetical protein VOB72_04855 [Candidatus Dormibacteraeota bacterium]|nr:hypothetical protein [Candidatus Dormibacteraeota bacterium]
MRLEPGELPGLPLPAALVAADGAVVAATPEWTGPGPGTLSYRTGTGHLLVAPDVPQPELDTLVARLLAEIRAAGAALTADAARQAEVLAAGLELVAGRPVGAASGTVEEVVDLTVAAVRARTQRFPVEVALPLPLPRAAVPAPAAIALALVQLAVNAQQHEEADAVRLRVGPGPTFAVEWAARPGTASGVRSHRHPLRRPRWGWGYVQMVADALGGVALPPGPAGPGLASACLGLGAPRLGLPLACVHEGRVERSTEGWDDDPAMPPLGQPAGGELAELVAAAAAQPGRIVYRGLHRARLRRDRTWAALAPESGSSRARDLLRGLHHERALWSAPEPQATRVSALTTLLQVAMGEPWPGAPPSVWAEVLPAACAALGVAVPPPVDWVCPPDPRVVAYLLADTRGQLVARGDEAWLAGGDATSPVLRALGADARGWLRINA